MAGVVSSTAAATRKVSARVALIGVTGAPAATLRDSFRQFGIETVEVTHEQIDRFAREKFEGCVVILDDRAEAVLHAARNSRSNRRMVIYGISGNATDAMRFSRFGVNALFKNPVERMDSVKVVRSTQLLVLHELRCYVRIPFASRVSYTIENRSMTGTSQELSGGGMSIKADSIPQNGARVRVQFDLASRGPIAVAGTVCWTRDRDKLFGLRYNPDDPGRVQVKEWIDEYLEIG
jgi:hypothetical protein